MLRLKPSFTTLAKSCALIIGSVVEESMLNSAVLIVDDEPLIRETVSELLSSAGLCTLEAANGPEALEMLNQNGHTVAVLLTDIRMPGGMNGIELARIAQRTWPWIKVIVMSGF